MGHDYDSRREGADKADSSEDDVRGAPGKNTRTRALAPHGRNPAGVGGSRTSAKPTSSLPGGEELWGVSRLQQDAREQSPDDEEQEDDDLAVDGAAGRSDSEDILVVSEADAGDEERSFRTEPHGGADAEDKTGYAPSSDANPDLLTTRERVHAELGVKPRNKLRKRAGVYLSFKADGKGKEPDRIIIRDTFEITKKTFLGAIDSSGEELVRAKKPTREQAGKKKDRKRPKQHNLRIGSMVAINPVKPRTFKIRRKKGDVEAEFLMAWSTAGAGSGWVPVSAIKHGPAIARKLHETQKAQFQIPEKAAKREALALVLDNPHKSDEDEGKLHVKWGVSSKNADLFEHYLPRYRRCYLCLNLPDTLTAPVARDVVRSGEQVRVHFSQESPLFKRNANEGVEQKRVEWVFCSVVSDPQRCGWIPRAALGPSK